MGRQVTTPRWEYAQSTYLPKWHCLVYRDEKLGVQREEYTRRQGSFLRRSQKISYSIIGVEKRFKTEKQLMRAWERKSKKGHVDTTIRIVARECLLFVLLIAVGFLYVEVVYFHQFLGLERPHDLVDEFLRSLKDVSRPYFEERWLSLLAPYLTVQAGRFLFFSIRRLTRKQKPLR